MFNKKNTIITVFVIFGMFAYMGAPQKEIRAQEEPLVVPDVSDVESGSNQKGRDILNLLADLKAVKLDNSIFSDPAFSSLKDLSVELIPEPKGRPNPFAPLGQDAVLSEEGGSATTSPREISFTSGATAAN